MAFAVNLVSVLSSAATVLLTHLVIVRLARVWMGTPEAWAPWQRLAANAGGAIGALAFAATDSFWFNAVEAEVYGMSMLFTAAVVWLALVWRERTREEESAIRARGGHPFGLHADRLLVAIAYLFGLAIGVHLLNVLALFFVALIVYYEKVERTDAPVSRNLLMLAATGLVAAVIFVAIYPGVVQWLPTMAAAFGSPLVFLFLVVALLAAAVWWTQKNHRPIANLIALSATVIIIGYSSYAVIFIRSAADPPIDENDPETADAIVSYLKREQFGSTPLLKGYTYEPSSGIVGYVADPISGQLRPSEEVAFPRRHSLEPSHLRVYGQYDSDLDFFIRYQLGHMFGRYFMWQFVGKAADTQDAGWISGLSGKGELSGLTPSERAGRNAYYGLPLLLGLLGLAFHTQKDWRRSLAVGRPVPDLWRRHHRLPQPDAAAAARARLLVRRRVLRLLALDRHRGHRPDPAHGRGAARQGRGAGEVGASGGGAARVRRRPGLDDRRELRRPRPLRPPHRDGLRAQHAGEHGAQRHPLHERRQRHLPAVVPPGGRGRPPRRARGEPLAPQHAVVHQAAQEPVEPGFGPSAVHADRRAGRPHPAGLRLPLGRVRAAHRPPEAAR